ncbi:MAG: EAL domain-containing protein, partial [Frankiales bacterium]|nr:EAL domain-containing protein [Frankiales bacterium]
MSGPVPVMAVQDILDALDAATCAVGPDGLIVAVNGAWRSFSDRNGGDPGTCGVGADYLGACDRVDQAGAVPGVGRGADDADDAVAIATGLRHVLEGGTESQHRTYACHGPEVERWFSVRIVALPVAGGRGALVSHSDVSVQRRTEHELTHQALHDALTGLPNRALLVDRLARALADGRRLGTHVAVAFLDLDHFKRVNDSFGHAAGDALLVQVAQRLTSTVGEDDTLARYAGDEFVAVWVGLGSPEQAWHLGDRFGAALEQGFALAGRSVQVGASVGVALATDEQTGEDLLLAADAAMHDAKRHGRGGVRVFNSEMRLLLVDRLQTELDLRAALERDELVLHYQPVVAMTTGQPVAVEALARWQHPRRGLLGPDQFISVAEDSGLIVALGRWALLRACHDAADPAGPLAGLDVAVNLSARQLGDPGVVGHVRAALTASGLDPRRLLLEVTESAVVGDERAAALALEEIAALGVGVAIDDFGTGWSSLLYLRRYPVSTLKIDRAFVAGLGRSQDDEAIC